MSLVRDLCSFTREVLSSWWLRVIAFLDVVAFLTDYLVPKVAVPAWLHWAILGVAFYLAVFDAWRKLKYRIDETEGRDADIRLEPMKAPRDIRFNLPESYQLVTPVVPPTIHLYVNFLVINRGEEVGSLHRVDVVAQEFYGESSITFQLGSLFPDLSLGGRPGNPLMLPLTLKPNDHQNVTYVLSARITERDPQTFAKGIGRLTSFRITFRWHFSGRDVDIEDKVEVQGSFERLKAGIYRHWHDVGREDLVETAQRQST